MTLDEEKEIVLKWADDVIEKSVREAKISGEKMYEPEFIEKLISEMAYYLALKKQKKLDEKDYSDALLWVSAMGNLKMPDMSYAVIYHFTHDELDFSKARFDNFGSDKCVFNDSNKFFYLLSESCSNKEVADFYYVKMNKHVGGEKMIFDMFRRVWKAGKLDMLAGHYMIGNVYTEDIADNFVDLCDTNKTRGISRSIKYIKGMCV